MVYQLFKEKGMIQTGDFRDRLGISRKCAIILLEGLTESGLQLWKMEEEY